MQELEVINILKEDLNFTDQSIEKLKEFTKLVLKENKNRPDAEFMFSVIAINVSHSYLTH